MTRDFDYEIDQVLATSNRIVVVEERKSGTTTYQIHILSAFENGEQMELLKTVNINVLGSSNAYFSIFERQLRVKYGKRIATYNLETFQRTDQELFHVIRNNRNHGSNSDRNGIGPFREGVIRDGYLYNPLTGAKLAVLERGPFHLTGVSYSYDCESTNSSGGALWLVPCTASISVTTLFGGGALFCSNQFSKLLH